MPTCIHNTVCERKGKGVLCLEIDGFGDAPHRQVLVTELSQCSKHVGLDAEAHATRSSARPRSVRPCRCSSGGRGTAYKGRWVHRTLSRLPGWLGSGVSSVFVFLMRAPGEEHVDHHGKANHNNLPGPLIRRRDSSSNDRHEASQPGR